MNQTLIDEWIKRNEPQGATKLAASAEISPSTLANIRRGTHEPNSAILRRLAYVLEVTIDDLLYEEPEPPYAA